MPQVTSTGNMRAAVGLSRGSQLPLATGAPSAPLMARGEQHCDERRAVRRA
jgi:hypothetical protein